MPRARYGVRYFDLLVTDDAAYLVRIPGVAPEWIGFLLGLGVSGLAGWWIGSLLARGATPGRLAALRALPAEALAARAGVKGTVRLHEIERARAVVGKITTNLRVLVPGRWLGHRRVRLHWVNHHLAGVDVPSALAPALGPRLVVQRGGGAWRAVAMCLVVLLGVFVTAGFIVARLDAGDQPSASTAAVVDRPGYPEAEMACSELNRYNQAAAEREPTAEESAAAVDDFANRMNLAASQDSSFAPAAVAARELHVVMTDPTSPMLTDDEITTRTTAMDAACARVYP